MAEESRKSGADDFYRDDRLDDSDDDLLDEELESGEEDSGAKDDSQSGSDEESLSAADSGWFVDFDVWQATLEAKFGPEFEQVLSQELGPDWINKLNQKIKNANSFHKVLDDIKRKITANTEQSPEQLFELDDGSDDDHQIGFEALGPGEVIYDESVVGPVGRGGGAGGGGGRSVPNLSDVRKKAFDAAGQQKSQPDEGLGPDELEDGATTPDDEVVLMDRNDFSRLSYFARKELDRHKDDPETRKILERESKNLQEQQKLGGLTRLIFVVAALILLYGVYCLVALPVGEYYEDKIAAANPPEYTFRPSTTLHKQGELNRAGDPNVPGSGSVLSFYFLQPSLNRFELHHLPSAEVVRYDIALYNGKNLEIDQGPWGGRTEVHRFYTQGWPTNRSAIIDAPYLSLSLDGESVLLAFERSISGLLPGLLVMDIVTGDGGEVGMAYVSDGLLQIRLADPSSLSGQEETDLTKRLVFLFSLLEL